MNPKGRDFPGAGGVSRKRFLLASFLAMLCALLTGCPHNDYTVELKPKTNGVERTLIFIGLTESIPTAFLIIKPSLQMNLQPSPVFILRGR